MPPRSKSQSKASSSVQKSPEAALEDENHEQLQKAVFSSGLGLREPPQELPRLRPGKILAACDGLDIVKKGSTRRARYLLAIPGNLGIMAGREGTFPKGAQTIGNLESMDTRQPVLTLDAPGGVFRLTGTVVVPRSKLLLLQCEAPKPDDPSSGSVSCDDVFDAVITFPKVEWIPKDNEELTPDPPSIAKTIEFRAGSGRRVRLADQSHPPAPVSSPPSPKTKPSSSSSSQRHPRRRKRVDYAEKLSSSSSSSASSSSHEGSEFEDDEQVQQLDADDAYITISDDDEQQDEKPNRGRLVELIVKRNQAGTKRPRASSDEDEQSSKRPKN